MNVKFIFVNLILTVAGVFSNSVFAQETEVLLTPNGVPQTAASPQDGPASALGGIGDKAFPLKMRTGHGTRQHTIYQRFDGNLTGRVSRFLPSGALVPAQAKVHLVRNSTIVASASSNDEGTFQIVSLEPGVYGVIAAGRDGCAAFSIRVYAHDDKVEEARMWLHMTLLPPSSIPILCELICNRKPPEMLVYPVTSMTGGGAGGAPIWGLAGLAGLTGITGEASPAAP